MAVNARPVKKDGTFERIYRSYLPDAELSDLLIQ